jgi:hypothetical protein
VWGGGALGAREYGSNFLECCFFTSLRTMQTVGGEETTLHWPHSFITHLAATGANRILTSPWKNLSHNAEACFTLMEFV